MAEKICVKLVLDNEYRWECPKCCADLADADEGEVVTCEQCGAVCECSTDMEFVCVSVCRDDAAKNDGGNDG